MTSCSTVARRRATAGAVRKWSRSPSPISDRRAARAFSARRRDQAPVRSSAARKRATSSQTSRMPVPLRASRSRAPGPVHSGSGGRISRGALRIIGDRPARRRGEFAVRLVDEDEIGELDNATLDPLELVARRRQQDQHEEVDDLGDRGLRLADTNRLDQHRVKPGRLAAQHRLAGMARDAAPSVAGRGGPDKGLGHPRQLGHAGLVAEDGTPAALRRRIDGQHLDTPAERDPVEAKALDDGRFAGAVRTGYADACACLGVLFSFNWLTKISPNPTIDFGYHPKIANPQFRGSGDRSSPQRQLLRALRRAIMSNANAGTSSRIVLGSGTERSNPNFCRHRR